MLSGLFSAMKRSFQAKRVALQLPSPPGCTGRGVRGNLLEWKRQFSPATLM